MRFFNSSSQLSVTHLGASCPHRLHHQESSVWRDRVARIATLTARDVRHIESQPRRAEVESGSPALASSYGALFYRSGRRLMSVVAQRSVTHVTIEQQVLPLLVL